MRYPLCGRAWQGIAQSKCKCEHERVRVGRVYKCTSVLVQMGYEEMMENKYENGRRRMTSVLRGEGVENHRKNNEG